MSPPPAEEKKDEKKPEKKEEKKTFVQKIISFLLIVFALVIAVLVLNALLGILFPGIGQTIRITGQGLSSAGAELTMTSVGLGVFMQGLFTVLIRIILIVLGLVATALIFMALGQYMKKKREEART